MDDLRSKKESKTAKKDNFDGLVVTAINVAAMSASVAAAISAKAKKSSLEDAVAELSVKVDKLSEQIRQVYNTSHGASQDVQSAESGNKKDTKTDHNSPQKSQEVIYVRKASEFSFYN